MSDKPVIGLDRNKVELVDYNPAWPELFRQEAEFLKSLLGDEIIAVDHFGSTAIPGIKAKPVIDVLIQIPTKFLSAEAEQKLKDNNYDKRVFDHRDEPMYPKMIENNIATHNLHFTKISSKFAETMIAFRNKLRADPALAKEYETLKTDMAKNFTNDRQAYYKAKVAFFEKAVGKYN
jgi:GrpB-like predicted nucleotidyltransferase (UPF0157 family)